MSANEHAIHVSIARFLEIALPAGAIFYAVPNGGHLDAKVYTDAAGKRRRHSPAAYKLKREGLKAGVADLIIQDPVEGSPWARVIGLEVKAEAGRQNPNQKDWAAEFTAANGRYFIVRSVEDAAAALQAAGVKLRAVPSSKPGRLYEST